MKLAPPLAAPDKILIFFETFRCLFDVAPTKKDAMELMKDAMSHSKDFLAKPKKKKPTNATLH